VPSLNGPRRKSFRVAGQVGICWRASEGIADWGEEFHALMLGDRLRMKAWTAARRLPREGLRGLLGRPWDANR
jgi:hypothetical protein